MPSLWRFHARERAVFRPRSCPHFCIFLNRERARSINIEDRSRKNQSDQVFRIWIGTKIAYYFRTNFVLISYREIVAGARGEGNHTPVTVLVRPDRYIGFRSMGAVRRHKDVLNGALRQILHLH